MHRIVRSLAFAAALAAGTAVHAEDAGYPDRPVRIIVPFAAGGPPGVISRIRQIAVLAKAFRISLDILRLEAGRPGTEYVEVCSCE
jgi:tripartite-type tricarboxylate transporter receptor subunit TctC